MARPLPYGAVISAAIVAIEREHGGRVDTTVKEITAWMEEHSHLFEATLATTHWKTAVRRCLFQSACFQAGANKLSWRLDHSKLTISAKAVVRKLECYWQRHPNASMKVRD